MKRARPELLFAPGLCFRATAELTRWYSRLGIIFIPLLIIGCSPREEVSPASTPSGLSGEAESAASSERSPVYAQGQLLPADGVIKIVSSPGDTVENLHVAVGSKVERGQLLAEMRSARAISTRRKSLQEQRLIARREQDAVIRQAELQRSAAELKLRQAQVQRQLLNEQVELLELGRVQLQASEQLLGTLISIANDRLTREFVGSLDVDRQRLAVEDARFKFAEQEANVRRASKETELTDEAAKQELESAETALRIAMESDSTKLVDLQLQALDTEARQSLIEAPSDGVILALGAAAGGTAVQAPLIEMANLDRIVCEVEVNVADASRIYVGQKAKLKSRALTSDLNGLVIEKSRQVGRPRLRSLDPLAAADYRTVVVMLEVDNPELASSWLQLQVEVVFEP